jgi:hypothetical protein
MSPRHFPNFFFDLPIFYGLYYTLFLEDPMKKIGITCVIGAVLFSATFSACNNKKESAENKGPIEKFTDKTAKEIVDKIQAPINKARSEAKKADERIKEMEEASKK